MTHQGITKQTDQALQAMTEAIDVGKRVFSATIDLNIALAQQGWRSAAVVPYLGVQMMQTLLGYALQFPLYGMRVWQHYLQQASLPLQQPIVTVGPNTQALHEWPDALVALQQPIVTVGPNTSFYFRGPENRLNVPAGNLAEFIRLAQEIDDATWQYHLRRGDYTHWFQTILQDEELAATAAELEHAELSARESRARMQDLIVQRYALPT
ncbi:MAG: hypothetical protein HGA45_02840 [Chloroflexales bacterium]|nr:hypothetical protein [Chloroflexales bacterium]